MDQLKNFTLGQNTGYDYLIAILIFFGCIVVLKIFQVIVLARLKKLAKKTKTDFDDVLIEIFTKIKPPLYFFVALYFGIKVLTLPQILNIAIKAFFIIAIVYEVVKAIERLLDYFLNKYISKTSKDETDAQQRETMFKTLKGIIRVILWLLAILMVLAHLGINVTSIIASLGIGGIAIALALQNILGDIFSSFSIYIDKPFQVGDFIVVGKDMGTVEKIGLKTTRIRTLQGEELIIANQELTTTRVQNFKKMERRRIVFTLGVVYGTDPKKLEKIPTIIKNIIDSIKKVEFDRCHFKSYGDFSLNYEIIYYVDSADYAEYMDINQKINLDIYQAFAKEKIEFAYPTQTIFVNK